MGVTVSLQKSKIIFSTTLVLFFCIIPAQKSFSEAVSGCHCFRNRAYDPAQKFAADDYILATSFNSLLSKAYDIPKPHIIKLKMQSGVSQKELLVGLRTAQVTGAEIQQILMLREGKYSWQEILSSPAAAKNIKNDKLLKAVQSGLPVNDAGPKAADLLLAGFFNLPLDSVADLRASGLNEKEMALVLVLTHNKDKQPTELVKLYKKEGKSWSEIAYNLGIEPGMVGKLIKSYPSINIKPTE